MRESTSANVPRAATTTSPIRPRTRSCTGPNQPAAMASSRVRTQARSPTAADSAPRYGRHIGWAGVGPAVHLREPRLPAQHRDSLVQLGSLRQIQPVGVRHVHHAVIGGDQQQRAAAETSGQPAQFPIGPAQRPTPLPGPPAVHVAGAVDITPIQVDQGRFGVTQDVNGQVHPVPQPFGADELAAPQRGRGQPGPEELGVTDLADRDPRSRSASGRRSGAAASGPDRSPGPSAAR